MSRGSTNVGYVPYIRRADGSDGLGSIGQKYPKLRYLLPDYQPLMDDPNYTVTIQRVTITHQYDTIPPDQFDAILEEEG